MVNIQTQENRILWWNALASNLVLTVTDTQQILRSKEDPFFHTSFQTPQNAMQKLAVTLEAA